MTITFDQAISTLTSEGHTEDDVLAAIDSLIIAGLDLEDAVSEADLRVLRDQLNSWEHDDRVRLRDTITFDEAINILTNEGHMSGDVHSAIDFLIGKGTAVEGAVSENDLEVLRDRLNS